jgi:hypothetical protein
MTALPHQQLLAQTKVLRDQLHFCPENDQHRNRNTCDPARHHPSKSASTVSYQRPTLGDHVLRLTGGYSGEGCQADQSAGRQTAGFNKPSSGSFLRVIGHLLLLESGSDPLDVTCKLWPENAQPIGAAMSTLLLRRPCLPRSSGQG